MQTTIALKLTTSIKEIYQNPQDKYLFVTFYYKH